MCESGDLIQATDEYGNAVFLCARCGGVFTVIHNCAVHMICAVDDALYVLGDMDSECEGVITEGRGVAEVRCLLSDLERETISEPAINQCRDAAAWN